ncbi:PTS sugar transporter subunit IIC [Halorussus gelatinilyticus]|uniref:PTS sugar transporter subunit IIC n=1 Tax=Halorussus gelatinilyticus TaxID=2937524 RepID=A0A8U0IJI5_9EURY|nr:PTS fructose transporter subunit IIB [Halorussus gelatinilyticus]UPW01193.1 PTS sugar transporter subunit IIC [Halorussus gelatinilyticus]
MRLVAVTACPTGIAHSQMGAESLARAATDAGHDIEVEVHAAMGTENELGERDLDRAAAAVVAADVRVDTDRFEDLPTVVAPVGTAVSEPERLVERAVELGREGDAETVRVGEESADGTGGGLLDGVRRLFE